MARTIFSLRAFDFVGGLGFVSLDRRSLDVEHFALYSSVFGIYFPECADGNDRRLSRLHSQNRARYRIRDAGVLGFEGFFNLDGENFAAFLVRVRVSSNRASRLD